MTREGNELTQVTVKTEINDYQQEIVTEYGLQIFYQEKNKSIRFSNALIFTFQFTILQKNGIIIILEGSVNMNPTKAEYLKSCVAAEHYPNLDYPAFVFLGRSNVGKSSFINALTSRKNLAYTSSKPGKTVALNFYNIDDKIMFVDVPGYGYAQRRVDDRLKYGGNRRDKKEV